VCTERNGLNIIIRACCRKMEEIGGIPEPIGSIAMNGGATNDPNPSDTRCARCHSPGSDVRFNPCGCTVHARCLPLSILSDYSTYLPDRVADKPVPPTTIHQKCCLCQHTVSFGGPEHIESVELFPLSFADLEQAGELRHEEQLREAADRNIIQAKNNSGSAFSQPSQQNSKESSAEFAATEAAERRSLAVLAPFLGLSHLPHDGSGKSRDTSNSSSSSSRPTDYRRRTGRWTPAETAYVDFLVRCFEMGLLPLPQGIKLNEFLSDALMCKPSRLTKKMKNAKLSTKSYKFGDWTNDDGSDGAMTTGSVQMGDRQRTRCAVLSHLESQFIQSISSAYHRLELRFNLERMWRTQLSNLCLQLGVPCLDVTDWISSLDEMERRGAQSEEAVRRAERRRMGLALQQDAALASCGLNGVYIGGIHGKDGAVTHSKLIMDTPPSSISPALSSSFSAKADTMLSGYSAATGRPRADSMTVPVMRPRSGSIAVPFFPNPLIDRVTVDGREENYSDDYLATTATEATDTTTSSTNTTTQAEMDFLNELFHAEQTNNISEYLAVASAGIDGTHDSDKLKTELTNPSTTSPPMLQTNTVSTTSMVSMESIQESTADESSSVSDESTMGLGGEYLDKVIKFLEKMNAPFQYVDVWVPSFLPSDSYDGTDAYDTKSAKAESGVQTPLQQQQNLRLCHAGHGVRTDPLAGSQMVRRSLIEFGEYSSNFSFAPGKGAPGRVYTTGVPTWENDIHNATPEHFKRLGGAKLYGIKTLAAFPVRSPTVGRVVVILYSTIDVKKDIDFVRKMFSELHKCSPEPHWRLVVDVGNTVDEFGKVEERSVANSSAQVPPTQGRDHAPSPMTIDGPDNVRSSVDEAEEQEIIASLGESLPIEKSSDTLTSSMLSLRLLLLRERDRRSGREKDLLDIVKRSYRSYLRSNIKRTNEDVARLLARDWLFLSSEVDAPQSNPSDTSNIDTNKRSSEGTGKAPEPSLITPRSEGREVAHVDHRKIAACPMPSPASRRTGVQLNSSSRESTPGNRKQRSPLTVDTASMPPPPLVGVTSIDASRKRAASAASSQGPPAPGSERLHSFHHGDDATAPAPGPNPMHSFDHGKDTQAAAPPPSRKLRMHSFDHGSDPPTSTT